MTKHHPIGIDLIANTNLLVDISGIVDHHGLNFLFIILNFMIYCPRGGEASNHFTIESVYCQRNTTFIKSHKNTQVVKVLL
jgi:hypothetical protein